MGSIDSVFIADDELVDACIGKSAYFGEVLGKHSGVVVDLNVEDLKVCSENQLVINELVNIFGSHKYESWSEENKHLDEFNTEVTTISGLNPIVYIFECEY
jgi:hypothetical protein